MESPTPESIPRARRILRNCQDKAYPAQQAEQECRVERQALLTEYYERTTETSRKCAVDDHSSCGQSTALDNTHIDRKQLDWSKYAVDQDLAIHTTERRTPFKDTACRPSTHNATEHYEQTSSEPYPILPDPEIQISMEPVYISHEASSQPLDHHLSQHIDLAIARLEQRIIKHIDTTHQDLATHLHNITLSFTAIENKVSNKQNHHTTPHTKKQNNKKMNDSLKGLGESIARSSAATDALGARFGLQGKKDEEVDVCEWEKDDCVERFA
ncbi:hypothetical protein KCU91_g225, partial [Aureobasidium melanogenum]